MVFGSTRPNGSFSAKNTLIATTKSKAIRTGLCFKAAAIFLIGDSADKVYEISFYGRNAHGIPAGGIIA